MICLNWFLVNVLMEIEVIQFSFVKLMCCIRLVMFLDCAKNDVASGSVHMHIYVYVNGVCEIRCQTVWK